MKADSQKQRAAARKMVEDAKKEFGGLETVWKLAEQVSLQRSHNPLSLPRLTARGFVTATSPEARSARWSEVRVVGSR
jgi:hypothetical protein